MGNYKMSKNTFEDLKLNIPEDINKINIKELAAAVESLSLSLNEIKNKLNSTHTEIEALTASVHDTLENHKNMIDSLIKNLFR